MAQAAQPSPQGSLMSTLILMVPMILIFYFLLIRPQNQARKKHQEMIMAVRRGDTVVTSGGLVGKVTKVPENGDEITIELAEGVQVTCVKATLSDVRSKTQPKDNK
jgi:preprotein translocase subunit YajC